MLHPALTQAEEKQQTFLTCAGLFYECQLMQKLLRLLATSPNGQLPHCYKFAPRVQLVPSSSMLQPSDLVLTFPSDLKHPALGNLFLRKIHMIMSLFYLLSERLS